MYRFSLLSVTNITILKDWEIRRRINAAMRMRQSARTPPRHSQEPEGSRGACGGGRKDYGIEGAIMKDTWQRDVPVFDVPIWTRPFIVLCGLAGVGLILVAYREVVGLGPASGMNDAYAWGIWKTFNTMVLTGLGSGAFAIGIAAWIFRRDQLHVVMRTALLTSFLAYAFGLAMLGVDVGRPWNFYWILAPWRWNLHSPLLEVAVCMSIYASIPLFLENIPPVLEYAYDRWPRLRPSVKKVQKLFVVSFPWVVSLAYVLPAMHQSSLGALMLLGGTRVFPLWQTPFLPLLYVWAAAFLGFAFVSATLLFCGVMWTSAARR